MDDTLNTYGLCDQMHWYVVRTKPKQEMRAELNLRLWGLETLLPMVRDVPGDGRSIQMLFPSYIFARFCASALLPRVRFARGVQTVIGLGEYATPVDDTIIAAIRGRMSDDGFVRIEEPQPGDTVRIADGPFKSLLGLFERRRGSDRAVILLATIAATVRVEVASTVIRRSSGSYRTPHITNVMDAQARG